jgi:DNA-binding transcriptional LysR family regulator
MLPLNDMMLFVEVVKYKSFTIAAQKNNITPAGISKRISFLEKALQAKLLKRTTRCLALTEAGKILYQHCQNIHIDTQNIIEAVRETYQRPRGKIKIAALQNVSNLIIAPLIDKFLQLYSDIEIVITFDGALGPLPAIGEYDIAFRSGKLIDSSAIARLLFTHEYFVCATPLYLRRYGIPVSLEDLKNHNCIDCRNGLKGAKNIWVFYDGKQHHSISVKGNIHTDNALLVKNLALNNAALIYSPTFIVAEEINQGKLVPVLKQYKTLENSIYVIHPYAAQNMPMRVKTFIDFVFNHLTVPSVTPYKLTEKTA